MRINEEDFMRAYYQKQFNNFFTFPAFLVLLLLLASCGKGTPQDSEPGGLPSDSAISATLQKRFKQAPDLPLDSLQIMVENGTVTLRGTAPGLLIKNRATEVAASRRGVRAVNNAIQVTTERPDTAIAADVRDAIAVHAANEHWDISIGVNQGTVTLSGTVDSWQVRYLVEDIVSGVRGVKNIENALLVDESENRTASDMENEIGNALLYDARIGDALINISVANGVVNLGGSVSSVLEKRLAVGKAHVAGIEKVVADNLEVNPEISNRDYRNKLINSLTPEEIEEAVIRTFVYDPRVDAENISITWQDSIAILTGRVSSLNAKLSAAEDARSTVGVSAVQNNIVISPDPSVTDSELKNHVLNALKRDPYAEVSKLIVSVEKGTVTLGGAVSSQFIRQHVETVVSRLRGVVDIDNQLQVVSGETEVTG